jgi:hypothetical protein
MSHKYPEVSITLWIKTMQTPRTTIEMASTLKWNISCSVLNDPRSLIDVAQIIERSTYDDIAPLLTIETIELVYVYSICNRMVGNHPGYSGKSTRRLQNSISEIKLLTYVSSGCDRCSELIFNETAHALAQVVDNGTLTKSIQDNSNGTIRASINPGVDSTYVIVGNPTTKPSTSPTSSPTPKPSSGLAPGSPTDKPTPEPTLRPSKKIKTPAPSKKKPKQTKKPTKPKTAKKPQESKSSKDKDVSLLYICCIILYVSRYSYRTPSFH